LFLLVLFLFLGAGCGGERRVRLLEEGGALWEVSGAGERLGKLARSGQYEKAIGGQTAYYVFFDLRKGNLPLCVIECGNDGIICRMQEYDNDAWHLANAIDCVMCLGQGRIFVDTHVNPSLGIGIEIDLDARKTDVFYGVLFTWNGARNRLAYFREPPHFGTPPGIPSKLMVGHTEICEVPRVLHSELYWHPTDDKLLAFIPPGDGQSGQVVAVEFPESAGPHVTRYNVIVRPAESFRSSSR
jgi:hypothetical protein